MPELPEVETVRRGLAPVMVGARFSKVTATRPDLRFPLPKEFTARLTGAGIEALDRRGKYLIAALSTGESLIMHLGMSGRFTIHQEGHRQPGNFVHGQAASTKHDHVIFETVRHRSVRGASQNLARIVYNDPRRFGFMDLWPSDDLENCRHFQGMGPEPLGNSFNITALNERLKGRQTPIKAALLDQCVVAGLGNIYVCEALYRAGISPRRKAASVCGVRAGRLYPEIIAVLREAIEAGGSTLRDFAATDGDLGYFQHRFAVYDREGDACAKCNRHIQRIVQSGRSTFFCGGCQR